MTTHPVPDHQHLAVTVTLLLAAMVVGCSESWPPPVQQVPAEAPILSPDEALSTFNLPPGYRIELVASEPLVRTPVALDFDPDGRIWVVEMRGYMRNVDAEGENEPTGRIVVLEDRSGDGRMDTSTVYMDGLVLPRAVKVLSDGVLVGAPPYLWHTRDTTGDHQADEVEVLRDDFGNPAANPEFNANGLLWGIDNWLHTTHYAGAFRHHDGTLMHEPAINTGQWGITMDDYGRIYRNYNYTPLHVDLVPSYYLGRNPDLMRTSGLYERAYRHNAVWPGRPTPGVNQAHLSGVLREDETLISYTSASGPAIYRGDRLPAELRGNAFIPEPAANLVQRLVMSEADDGSPIGENPYHADGGDFLTSTDERFRPVNIYSAPDGTLYVVDMYQGIIQHRDHMSEHLMEYIRETGLNEPTDLGRIYRIVHSSTEMDDQPRLADAASAELVRHLTHPNGWWRDTAQRLLVERGERSVAPALRELATAEGADHVRIHALWTLSGLDAVDDATLLEALNDSSPQVRAAAIRVAEPWLEDPGGPVSQALFALIHEPHPLVRRQLAASFGSLPPEERVVWLAKGILAHSDDPIVVDLSLGGLHGYEVAFLEHLVAHPEFAHAHESGEVVSLAVATITKGGQAGTVHALLARATSGAVPQNERARLLEGIEAALSGLYVLRLDEAPESLLAAVGEEPDTELAERLERILEKMAWPGKETVLLAHDVDEGLPPETAEWYAYGEELYAYMCAVCHDPNGLGRPGSGTRLVGSEWVVGPKTRLAQLLLHGLQGESLMPRLGRSLSDEELAAIMTYIRRDWGHMSSPVAPEYMRVEREASEGRDRPYTPDELRSWDLEHIP